MNTEDGPYREQIVQALVRAEGYVQPASGHYALADAVMSAVVSPLLAERDKAWQACDVEMAGHDTTERLRKQAVARVAELEELLELQVSSVDQDSGTSGARSVVAVMPADWLERLASEVGEAWQEQAEAQVRSWCVATPAEPASEVDKTPPGPLSQEQGAAIVAALESGEYFACDGEYYANLPDCPDCEGTGRLHQCGICGGMGKVDPAEGDPSTTLPEPPATTEEHKAGPPWWMYKQGDPCNCRDPQFWHFRGVAGMPCEPSPEYPEISGGGVPYPAQQRHKEDERPAPPPCDCGTCVAIRASRAAQPEPRADAEAIELTLALRERAGLDHADDCDGTCTRPGTVPCWTDEITPSSSGTGTEADE